MKNIPYQRDLKILAKQLRKNMTYSEVMFWKLVRNRSFMGYDFDRQKPILDYVVDFYCEELKLVIEIDGITHHDAERQRKDEFKDERLSEIGLAVLRFSAYEVIKDRNNIKRTLENFVLNAERKSGVDSR